MRNRYNWILVSALLVSACLFTGCGSGEETLTLGTPLTFGEEGGEGESRMAPDAQTGIWVHICGAVQAPGVYELPAGSRVCDALSAAGGFGEAAAENGVNLAEQLRDGQQVVIPTIEEQASRTENEEEQTTVNINTASAEKLCTLPGIGMSRAQSIIAYREKNGAFRSPEEIMQVEGIKEGMFAKCRDMITVEK